MGSSRRAFLKSVAAAAAVCGTSSSSGQTFEQEEQRNPAKFAAISADKRPNILYIHSHDTGRLTSPYGYSVPTPNLHRLASEGILFRQAFCAAPTCSPSRASLLTGECAHSNGMLGLVNRVSP